MIANGELPRDIVALGPWWNEASSVEIDAVGLSGRPGTAVLLGEAKWRKKVDASALVWELRERSKALPSVAESPVYAVCARERLDNVPNGAVPITAAEVFGV
ncbi:DUF234 domain-containing protein [Coriobacteriia bacterium Es71-Z0120]|uniref:DUF234 domain-containing protein n=1 Tax=Parvivirga hydrogeniphila TaxID=2939460 RepID=UPI002260903E|nr:DUF234 domain-containing protein [Parvivirga hydrogeniphila]MCL4078602.1 DUF234 domain-containing protein [Parvivirga hydrogeniphila]